MENNRYREATACSQIGKYPGIRRRWIPRLNARASPLTRRGRPRERYRVIDRAMLSVRDYRKCLHVDYFDR